MRDWNDEAGREAGRDPAGGAACPLAAEAVAYVQGELSPEAALEFKDHLAACPVCRGEVREAAEIIRRVQAAPAAGSREIDLLPRIARRLEAERRRAWRHRWFPVRPAAVAAVAGALAVAAIAAIAFWGPSRRGLPEAPSSGQQARTPEQQALDAAFEWLVAAQEPTGGWSAARWGGQQCYDVGLSALAVLALANAEGDPGIVRAGPRGLPSRARALARGVEYLLSGQASDGRFGPEFSGAPYNHAIATTALLEVYGAGREERFRAPIDRAIGFIVRTQAPEGGWQYLGAPLEEPNTALTCWPLQALLLARGLGWSGLNEPIWGGFKHLMRVADGEGRLGYRRAGEFRYGSDALACMGAFCVLLDRTMVPGELRDRILDEVARIRSAPAASQNLYRDFFLSSVVEALPRKGETAGSLALPASVAGLQVRDGPDRGSFTAQDPWVSAGGRLYATTLATLILQAERRNERLTRILERG